MTNGTRSVALHTLEEAVAFFDSISEWEEVEVYIEGLSPRASFRNDHYRLWVHPDRRVQFFGLPSRAHDATAAKVASQTRDGLGKLGSLCKKRCTVGYSARVHTRPGSKEPDVYLAPHSHLVKPTRNHWRHGRKPMPEPGP